MKGLLEPDPAIKSVRTFGVVDHFIGLNSATWTSTLTDSGTAAVGDEIGGVLTISPSDASVADNDEGYVATKEIFKIVNQKPIALAARTQFTQAATNAANVFVGLMDVMTANALQDNGAGPKASFSGAGFFAKDGSTSLFVIYSDGATQSIAELTATNTINKTAYLAASADFQLLEIDIVPKTSTLVDIAFQVNGSVVYKMLDRTYANATEISAGLGVKNGTAAQQALKADFFVCNQAL